MLALGVDPDLHTTGIAIVDLVTHYDPGIPQQFVLRWVGTARVGPEHKRGAAVGPMALAVALIVARFDGQNLRPKRVVVESQQMYAGVGHSPPADLICLAQAAGAACGVTTSYFPESEVLIPVPSKWSKGVPKNIRHARLKSRVLGFEMCRNEHERDAVGLAVWGLTQAAPAPLASRSAGVP